MKTGDRRGFTLSELMIVAVLGSVMVGATYQIMLSSQRALTIQTAQVQGQQTVRAGLDILFAELRELSRAEADILTMGPDRIEVRAMRAFGLVCGVDASGSPLRVRKMGRFFVAGDSVMVFADNDPDIASDDTILSGMVDSTVDTTQTCSGADTAQSLSVGALATALANDTVRIGAPVRGFTIYTYGLYSLERRLLSGPERRRDYGAPGWATLLERSLVYLQGLLRKRHDQPQGRLADRRDPSVGIGGPGPAGTSRSRLPYDCDLSAELTNDRDRSD